MNFVKYIFTICALSCLSFFVFLPEITGINESKASDAKTVHLQQNIAGKGIVSGARASSRQKIQNTNFLASNEIAVTITNNSVGSLARITKVLADADINILAINMPLNPEIVTVRMLTTMPNKAKDLLRKKGFFVHTKHVLLIQMPNKIGYLNDILQLLARREISVDYVYSIVPGSNELASFVFGVDEFDAAVETLENAGSRELQQFDAIF